MQSTVSDTGFRAERSDWLRLRTLILLRWMAIGGQVVRQRNRFAERQFHHAIGAQGRRERPVWYLG